MTSYVSTPIDSNLDKTVVCLLQEKVELDYIAKVSGLSIDELLVIKSKVPFLN